VCSRFVLLVIRFLAISGWDVELECYWLISLFGSYCVGFVIDVKEFDIAR
jgi:hypothetical protein